MEKNLKKKGNTTNIFKTCSFFKKRESLGKIGRYVQINIFFCIKIVSRFLKATGTSGKLRLYCKKF